MVVRVFVASSSGFVAVSGAGSRQTRAARAPVGDARAGDRQTRTQWTRRDRTVWAGSWRGEAGEPVPCRSCRLQGPLSLVYRFPTWDFVSVYFYFYFFNESLDYFDLLSWRLKETRLKELLSTLSSPASPFL